MKLIALLILKNDPSEIVNQALNLESVGFFQRPTVREFIRFFCRTVADRTKIGQKVSVIEKDVVINLYKREDGMIGCCCSDEEYPNTTAFNVINKMLIDPTPDLELYIKTYQDPANADNLTMVKKDVDEVLQIMRQNIDLVLKRGEDLDSLIKKSDELSEASKGFYNKSKKLNSCCVII
jgi:synaptobrevin family protein YKT6